MLEKGEINGKPIKDGQQVADLLASVIMASALKGDHRFVSLILERTEGKAGDKPEESTPEKASDAYADLLAKLYPDQPG